MIHEESEDMSLRVSSLEQNFKETMKTLEENMERIVNLLQHTEEKILDGDNGGQCTHYD